MQALYTPCQENNQNLRLFRQTERGGWKVSIIVGKKVLHESGRDQELLGESTIKAIFLEATSKNGFG